MSRRARKRASVEAAKWAGFIPLDPHDDADNEGSEPDLHQWGDEPVELVHLTRQHGAEPGAQA